MYPISPAGVAADDVEIFVRVILRQLLLRQPLLQQIKAALLDGTGTKIPIAKGSRRAQAGRQEPPELTVRNLKQRHEHQPSFSRRRAAEKTGSPLRSDQTRASRPALLKRSGLPQ